MVLVFIIIIIIVPREPLVSATHVATQRFWRRALTVLNSSGGPRIPTAGGRDDPCNVGNVDDIYDVDDTHGDDDDNDDGDEDNDDDDDDHW